MDFHKDIQPIFFWTPWTIRIGLKTTVPINLTPWSIIKVLPAVFPHHFEISSHQSAIFMVTQLGSQRNLVPPSMRSRSAKRKFASRGVFSFNDLPLSAKNPLPATVGFYPASSGGRVLSCLRFFFLLLSWFKAYNYNSSWSILTKLGYNNTYPNPYMSCDPSGVKGHTRVTGVKHVIFTKNASCPQGYVASLCHSCIWSS